MGSLNKKASGAQCFIMALGLFWDIVTGLPWTPNGVGSLEPRGYCIFLPGAHYLTINSPDGADSSLNKLLLLLLLLKSNMSLDSINKWFTANKLKLSLRKCVYTVFNLTRNNSLNIRYDLSINSTKLIRFNSTKYLSVYIDEDLTWQNHIHYIINKLVKFCSIF